MSWTVRQRLYFLAAVGGSAWYMAYGRYNQHALNEVITFALVFIALKFVFDWFFD